jgi:hypothetical protein
MAYCLPNVAVYNITNEHVTENIMRLGKHFVNTGVIALLKLHLYVLMLCKPRIFRDVLQNWM